MNTVIKLAQDDFKIWKESNHLFTQSVNELNTKFELRGNSSLISSVPPTYFAGDLTKGKKTLVVGINPGYGEKNIQFESTIRHRDWNSYLDFHLNFFDYGSGKAIDDQWCPINSIKCPAGFRRPDLILDVNTPEQYEFMRQLYEYLYPRNHQFHITDTIQWYDNVYKNSNP